ncbi:hypothetical protein AHYW_003664 [Providencia manganoxydans]
MLTSQTYTLAQTITVKPHNCTIVPPRVVDFGVLRQEGGAAKGELIASESLSLTVNCRDGIDTPAFATMDAPGGSGYDNYLRRTGGDDKDYAVSVRTFEGSNVPSFGDCQEALGLMSVDGNGPRTSIGILSSSSNEIPFMFSLCGQGRPIPRVYIPRVLRALWPGINPPVSLRTSASKLNF